MPRSPRPGAKRGSSEDRERKAGSGRRYWDLLRAAAEILPADLQVLRSRQGPYRPEVAGLAMRGAAEQEELLAAVGGGDASPQRRALVRDVARAGVLVEALLLMFAQSGDPELASRIGTLLTTRRSGFQALGLERFAVDVPTLAARLADTREASQEGAGAETAEFGDSDSHPADERRARGYGGEDG